VAEDVTVQFGALKALSEVSFTVEPGTIHAIIGPNGAGKSTMFNVLSGVYKATSGQVRFGDALLTSLRPHQIAKLRVARAFQNIALSGTQTVAENLMLGRHHLTRAGFLSAGLRLPKATREGRLHGRRVREIAEFLELGDKLETPVGVLSYGARSGRGRAGAVHEPDLLLLDEPVAGMNARRDAPHGRGGAGDPRRARDQHRARRARHGHGHGHRRPRHVLDFGRVDRRRHAREVQRDPRYPRLPRLGDVERADAGQVRAPPPSRAAPPASRPPREPCVNTFLTLLLNGISLGAIYALIALGFAIIFKAARS
jgi:ABC-type branched-subunit amino acid transport system ATPase component